MSDIESWTRFRDNRLQEPGGCMPDLFHAEVPTPLPADVLAAMAVTRRHTYRVLTKRHGRSTNTSPPTDPEGV